MKKLLSLLLIPGLILSACGGGGGSEGAGGAESEDTSVIGPDSEDATELTFWTFNEQHIGVYEPAVKRWNEKNPDRKIQLTAEVFPIEQMNNNLRLALQSGEGAPDIADIEVSHFGSFLEGEVQFEPMNKHVEPVLSDMVKGRFDLYSKDGNYYGMPYHVGATVMYYNKEIMKKAGVDIDSIKTWDDYVAAGKKVTKNTDAMMTTIETTDQFTFWPLIAQQGSDYFNDNGEVILDNQTNVQTLQFMNDLIYKHEIAEIAPGGDHHAEQYYGYMNDGGAASVMMPMWYMGRFIDYMKDLEGKIQIKPLPRWEEGGSRTAGMGGTGTVVTNQTENPELVKEFLAEAKLTKEGNIDLWTELGFDPPMHAVWDDPKMRESNQYYEYFHDGIFDMLLELNEEVGSLNITPETSDVTNEINTNVLNSAIRQQSSTPKEALEQAAESVRSGMSE
ncbi:ABC transporter substrate-binding protein [Salibacterium halotolerans]|uniref:Arabinosaccharide transport system substrate-binding protein n=1 Tax=Salibacterium halotolerans TaxID=1884432 RepID=A0A1I5XU57_9BACI|nr:extracellular solute-binding protein [Salibacterium halotolerans]SFQ35513.1 arabinosaccharide transport system substrate-binding protein [Salibacterium halotolerans]